MTRSTSRATSRDVERRRDAQSYWLIGNRLTILANGQDTDGRYDLIEGRLPAGLQTTPHRHTRYAEQLYVVEGEITVWLEAERHVLRPGESITIPIGTVHVVGNSGDEPARSLVIASPSGFARLIEEAGTPAVGSAPPPPLPDDLEKFERAAAAAGDENLGQPGDLPAR